MQYAIKHGENIIGYTALESGDPPMGFVHGAMEPTSFYTPGASDAVYRLYTCDTHVEISCQAIAVIDYSAEMGETCIEVTALVRSAQIYETFFRHHLQAYEKDFPPR
ncbi:Phage protein [Kosakonia sp. BK9b]